MFRGLATVSIYADDLTAATTWPGLIDRRHATSGASKTPGGDPHYLEVLARGSDA